MLPLHPTSLRPHSQLFESWSYTPAPTFHFLRVRARAPELTMRGGGSSAYRGFSHPRRKTPELGQETRLKPPPEGLSLQNTFPLEKIVPMCLSRPSLDWAAEEDSFLGDVQRSHLCQFYSVPETCLLCGMGWGAFWLSRYPTKPFSSLTTFPKPVAVGGCKEAEARRVHSQARHNASTQLPGLQLLEVLSLILWREAHALLSLGQMLRLHLVAATSLCQALEAQG